MPDVWVAYERGARSRWALELAADLARRTRGRLTVAHVAPPLDEPVADEEDLGLELLGLREDVRRREVLYTLVAAVASDVDVDVRVSAGRAADEVLEMVHREGADVIVAGTRGGHGFGPDLGRALLRRSNCPVLLVREQPDPGREPVLLACGAPAEDPDMLARLASVLGLRPVRGAAPAGRRDHQGAAAVIAVWREQRPWLAVVAKHAFPTLRGIAGLSAPEALVDAVGCPVLVLPHACPAATVLAQPSSDSAAAGHPPTEARR